MNPMKIKALAWAIIAFLHLPMGNLSAETRQFWINPNFYHKISSTVKLPEGITEEMVLQLEPLNFKNEGFAFFKIKGSWIAVMPCHFDVLKWENDKWANLYKGRGYGFNCRAEFFVKNGELYSLGRYGYWTGHSHLVKFNFSTGSWDIFDMNDLPDHYTSFIYLIRENEIFSLFGEYLNQSKNQRIPEPQGYWADMEQRQWQPLELVREAKHKKSKIEESLNTMLYQLKDYVMYGVQFNNQGGFLLIRKSDLSVHFLKASPGTLEAPVYLWIEDNHIHVVDAKLHDFTYDLDVLADELELVGKISKGKIEGSPNYLWWAFGLLVLPLAWWLRKKVIQPSDKRSLEQESSVVLDETDAFIQILKTNISRSLKSNELDELLGLGDISSFDIKRQRRSKIVAEINKVHKSKFGYELILRKRDPFDKRYYIYVISNGNEISDSELT